MFFFLFEPPFQPESFWDADITNLIHFGPCARPITLRLSNSQLPFPVPGVLLQWTSLWPCLRHGSLACSLPLPLAQASACRGHCPRTPFYHINTAYYNFIFMQSYHFFYSLITFFIQSHQFFSSLFLYIVSSLFSYIVL